MTSFYNDLSFREKEKEDEKEGEAKFILVEFFIVL